MKEEKEYESLLQAFDKGYLCYYCEDKIYYGTYYKGESELCEGCLKYKNENNKMK